MTGRYNYKKKCASHALHKEWSIEEGLPLHLSSKVPKSVQDKILSLCGKSTKSFSRDIPKFCACFCVKVSELCPNLVKEKRPQDQSYAGKAKIPKMDSSVPVLVDKAVQTEMQPTIFYVEALSDDNKEELAYFLGLDQYKAIQRDSLELAGGKDLLSLIKVDNNKYWSERNGVVKAFVTGINNRPLHATMDKSSTNNS